MKINIISLDNLAYNLYLNDEYRNFQNSQKQIRLHMDFGSFLNNKKDYYKYYNRANRLLRETKLKSIL